MSLYFSDEQMEQEFYQGPRPSPRALVCPSCFPSAFGQTSITQAQIIAWATANGSDVGNLTNFVHTAGRLPTSIWELRYWLDRKVVPTRPPDTGAVIAWALANGADVRDSYYFTATLSRLPANIGELRGWLAGTLQFAPQPDEGANTGLLLVGGLAVAGILGYALWKGERGY